MADGITEEDIRQWVRSFVWAGEYDADEIPPLIEDNLGVDDEVDEEWLRDVVAAEVAAKREAERAWPAVTDCDRLDRAFQALGGQGVIALHRAGFTQSDGLDEVEERYREAGGEASGYAGHCFYTTQDQEGALDGDGMYLGFGHLSGDDAEGVAPGVSSSRRMPWACSKRPRTSTRRSSRSSPDSPAARPMPRTRPMPRSSVSRPGVPS